MAERNRYKLEEIVAKLAEGKQRATYAAVAELLGVPAQTLMSGRTKSRRYSWLVAPGSGIPIGYDDSSIDPDCLAQIRSGERHFISDARTLEKWLEYS